MESFASTAGKVFSQQMLERQVAIWRAQGLTIVLTNGCYDLLHAGHILSLETARSQGDVLVVGVNSDASVRQLKGPERPLNTEEDRACVIAALACVDAVTIFSEFTADALLQLVQPHIYVKGGDYTPESLPEWETVRQYGGKVVFIPLLPGRSTTDLIASCRE
ncbi:MAG: D-glycero-beta-D-manno-heptose 1-phosphate adenylyltransferase [Armatimonadota bacterium]